MSRMLEIIFTSDIHGHVFPVDYASGTAHASGLLNLAGKIQKRENTLVLDGGDSLQGTPLMQYYLEHEDSFHLHPAAAAFNALGCDYFTLGNHDFNFGYDTLRKYIHDMKGRCLAANVDDLRGELGIEKTAVHVLPDGLKVGICGIVTDYVNVWEQPQNLESFQITDPFEAAKKGLEQLKPQCDICICIYHGGFEEDIQSGRLLSDTKENIGCRLMRELDYDILLTGHQHMAVEGFCKYGTYAAQPPANGVCCVRMTAEEIQEGMEKKAYFQISSELMAAGEFHKEEPYGALLPLEKETQQWLDVPVGRLMQQILPEGKLEAALYGSQVANLFNAVQLEVSGADFSCTSLGNMPVGFEQDVSMRNICAAYLFANTLVELEVDPQVLKDSLERCASYFTLKDGNPQVSEEFLKPKVEHYNYDFYAGLSYEFDLTKPVGSRVVKLEKADGTPLENKTYRLVTSNYRATGTGGYDALGKCRVLKRGASEMPELTAAYIKRHSPVQLQDQGRFQVKWGQQ